MSRDGFHERVPLRHRFPRVLQHLQPLFASDADEIGADRRATHQLVRADPVEGKNQMAEIDDRTESQIWIILRSCRSLTCRNRSLSL